MELAHFTIGKADLVIYCLILIFGIFGFLKGARRQFFSILVLLLTTVLSILIPKFVRLPLGDVISPLWAYLILALLIWIALYFVLSNIAGYFADKTVKSASGFSDRIWGMFFGLIKGMLLIILMVFLITFFLHPLAQVIPVLPGFLEESKLVVFFQQYNPLLRIKLIYDLRILYQIEDNPDYLDLLRADSNYAELRQQDCIRDILADEEVREMVNQGSYWKLAIHPKMQRIAFDQETLVLMYSVNLDKQLKDNI